MVRKYVLPAIFLLCYVAGIDNKDTFGDFSSKLSKYSVVNPQLVHRWTRSVNRQPESAESHDKETLSYALNIKGRKHFLHLKQNKDFLAPNFVQHSHDVSGNHKATYPKLHEHCYYHGEVEGYDNSLVALSTCSGLSGVIHLGSETYGLQPVPQSPTNEHLLYLLSDVPSEPFICGVSSETPSAQSHSHYEPDHSVTSLLRRKRNLPQTSYVELVFVVDNLRYNYKKKNETAVREEMVQMANLLDGYYKQLNIRVVLVGLEIFKDRNPFSVDGSAGEVLGEFVKWRKTQLLPRLRHDNAQFIVGHPGAFPGGVLGMAFVGSICSTATSGGINVLSGEDVVYISTVVAHEMGHNLGMHHDSEGCTCKANNCIMEPTAAGTNFSSCSEDYFETLIRHGGGQCLKNPPSQSDVVGIAECGDGLLDKGEECDCGSPEECTNKCCDAATCKFTFGSACAEGSCCSNCQIKVAGTPCRGSVNTCDLPEYCDGKSAFCPEDFYIMDGLSCENTAYCYEGRCQTYDYQCKELFPSDPEATKAADTCFQHANTKGNLFGNCGITSNGNYIKCPVADAMCGKVQCTSVDVNTPPPGAHVSIQVIDGESCVNADFNLGTDVLDPAYVNPGSPCAEGKTCLDFKCVNASLLLSDLNCDAQTTCTGRGVCNNQGNCHCNNGWAPPNCDKPGRGGSIDSGPAEIDYSVRNGLLIFFLLVLPLLVLLILGLLYIFKRDSLEPILKEARAMRHRLRSAPNSSANGQTNANAPADTGNTPPVPAPPSKPVCPPAPTTQLPGFRYGELDYWNMDTSTATKYPPAPVQGPGVPRPIPPKHTP
ncbi:disintegrin and metalloproteinase domain-containing protein 9 isoform X2 [Myripristis murdjan]|uniref:disintegrin and metalloproteinase domain-containing protein 9 isoform X2 n=1 Tax=Myripristis murdjan TaxID=586833 RepID=UPI00117614E9|nr:disintegrin and metalloproteinase domain-containing protein 9-like isoform X2 [Myripristis murdjan]